MSRPVTPAAGPWARWRLLALLAGVAATAVALLVGLGVVVWATLAPPAAPAGTPPTSPDAAALGQAHRDQIAASPMLQVPAAAASTPNIATGIAATMSLPAASGVGAEGVPTGFPHTPEGALAQLAAIEVRVIEAMSIPLTHRVHAAWSLPGGVPAEQWAMTGNVQAFLSNVGASDNAKDDTIIVTATPAAAQIKGTDGPDWVLGCVLLDVRAVIVTQARIGYGHCERLQWSGDRWLIAAGSPPATAPSTWPGSDLAIRAGWRTLTTG